MIIWQYLIPKHLLSLGIHRLMKIRLKWFKNAIIKWFVKTYQVDLTEAIIEDINQYEHFNAFFSRQLKPKVREIAPHALISPADGVVSQLGTIHQNHILTAKSQAYSLVQLLGSQTEVKKFSQGYSLTIYLSPKDYHRVHMPISGQLKRMIYLPGALFSVNEKSVANIPALLAKNERVICYFDTLLGEVAIILVGAIFVGSMETVWHGCITPPYGKNVKNWDYTSVNIHLNKGEELGRFNMGSTVIMLMGKQENNPFANTDFNQNIKMGQAL